MSKDKNEQQNENNGEKVEPAGAGAEEVVQGETDNVDVPKLELVEDDKQEEEELVVEEKSGIGVWTVIGCIVGGLALGFLIGSILVSLGY